MNRTSILEPLVQSDPRLSLDQSALVIARQNGFPVVATQTMRKDRAGMVLGTGIALLLGALTLFFMSNGRTANPAPTPVIAQLPAPIAPPPPIVAAPAGTAIVAAPSPVPPPPFPLTVPAVPINPNAALDRARTTALIFDNSGGPTAAAPAASPAAVAVKPMAQGLTPEEQFAERLGGEGGTARASHMVDPSTTVAQGTLITAVLETAIDSDLPGYVRALVSRDVKSFDGSRILIPRSSRLIGQYKSGLAAGQTRAYVLWTRLIRPDGVSIAIASPATDFEGRNGLAGKVDSHFFKRFGSAILLSMIGAAGSLGGGGAAVIVAGPQQVASDITARDVAIPPTVRVSQGQPIRIFTARDLDFSTVSTTPAP